jgi:hypothetical protein
VTIWCLITLYPPPCRKDCCHERPLSRNLRQAIGVATTGAAVIVAVIGARALWTHYQVDPWTRDGRVRAEVVQVAPDVQGLVTKVYVGNDQLVHRGDVLFEIDRARFELALHQAEVAQQKAGAAVIRAQAAIQSATASVGEARREATRNNGLGELVATETTEQSQTKVAEGEARWPRRVPPDRGPDRRGRSEECPRSGGAQSGAHPRGGAWMAACRTSRCVPATMWRRASRCWRWSIPVRCASRVISRKPSCPGPYRPARHGAHDGREPHAERPCHLHRLGHRGS